MRDPEPRFLVYSVTKTFIAVLFCRLADRGELRLDDRLAAFIGDARLPDVTLRRLLDHTAGVPDYADAAYGAAVRARPAEPWTDEELLAHALARRVERSGRTRTRATCSSDASSTTRGRAVWLGCSSASSPRRSGWRRRAWRSS